MEAFIDTLFADPMYYIGLLFAFAGAMGFLIWLRGFLAGTPHLFTMSGEDHHLHQYRTRQMWGVFIMLFTFIAWELLRYFVGYFS